MDNHFDLIAIGGGSGGLAVAEKAAAYGKRVAIVERQARRHLRQRRLRAEEGHVVRGQPRPRRASRREVGVRASSTASTGSAGQGREGFIAGILDYWNGYVAGEGITLIRATRASSTHTVEVDGKRYTADHIAIATGGRPVVPPVPGAELGITSDGFFQLTEQPKSGSASSAAATSASNSPGVLRALGSEVTVVALEPKVLETFDPIVSETVAHNMAQDGIELHLPVRGRGPGAPGDGIAVNAADGSALTGFDTVLWAVGRPPNT
jgi:pyruvate/2-oxoglutarate dehydrogenase complex dihydrolipoamide dehydrogenase (E3) component